MNPDRTIAGVAERQHGVFTHLQALRAGFRRGAIRHRRESGRWIDRHRGVYLIAGAPPTWKQDVMAAVLGYGDRAVASSISAAALWALIEPKPGPVHVTLPTNQHRDGRPGTVCHRASLTRGDMRVVDGIPATSPNRTLIDLTGVISSSRLEAALDTALFRRLISVRSLYRYIDDRRLGNQSGIGTLRRLLIDRSQGATESELERSFLRMLRRRGFPEPVRQYRLNGRRIDFAYPGQRIAIELDGLAAHFTGSAFRADRRRQNAIVLAGWIPLRFTWDDVTNDWPRVEQTLRAALASVG